jgi:nitroreductase
MEFFEVLEARHSIRAFQPRPVEEEKLQIILNAVNRAPSAGNLQSYEVYLSRGSAGAAALARATFNQTFVAQAPLVLVFCSHAARSVAQYGERGAGLYALQDATIACTFAMLAAAAQELASVWIGAFDPEAVRSAIGAPAGVEPAAMLPIGYPAQQPELTTRRPLNGLVHELPAL